MAAFDKENVGRRLFAGTLDAAAQKSPDRMACVIPKGTEVSDGFHNLTFKELAHAVNYTSWWIEENIGRSSNLETLSYMSSNDVRYIVFVIACNKTGYKALLPSTRNSDDAFLHLLKATECSKFVCGVERKARILDIKKLKPDLEIIEIPSLAEMLANEAQHYPYNRTYEEVKDETCLIIHSSGTTGIPKPVPLTHGYIACLDRNAFMPHPPNRKSTLWYDLTRKDLLLGTTPFFHLMGFVPLVEAIFHGFPFVTGPDKPLAVDFLVDVMKATRPTAALLPPSLLEEMSHFDRSIEALSKLKYVIFGGAPLAPEVGEKLRKYTGIRTVIGSSEAGLIPTMIPLAEEDWGYYDFNTCWEFDMQPVGDGSYELIITRPQTRDYHGIFHTYPHLNEYRTKDSFIQHPTKPHLWKYHGRLDDVIVLSNGEKFNPVTMEKIIEAHPMVSRALVVGEGRFQSALLIEPNWNLWTGERPNSDLIEQIWPTVHQANNIALAHGRIAKNRIGLASRDKPFKTTPKGTTQRRLVNQDYAQEIGAIYEQPDEGYEVQLPEVVDLAGLTCYIHDIVSKKMENIQLSEKDDLYSAGLDSLQTMQIAQILQSAVRSRFPDKNFREITAQQVYGHPTIEQLAKYVTSVISGDVEEEQESRAEKLGALVKKYTEDLPEQDLDVKNVGTTHTVILTGSTGSLGNYFLNALLNDPHVVKIYCLNRSDAKQKQEKSFQEKGLPFDEDARSKVEFLQVAFGDERFGLDESKYEEMLKSVDTIIHNAWKVDFNHSVYSFESVHIKGVRRFVDFSLKSTHHAHIHFVSSVGAIAGWKPKHGPAVPEEPLDNVEVILPQGYGESKHVAERICYEASRRSGVPTTILRVGQIGGPTSEKGAWNRQEWLPTIIATSKSMGKIPSTLGSAPVDWIPVDTLAKIILELADTRRNRQSDSHCEVFHLVNPATTAWSALIPAVEKHYPVKLVEFSDWIQELESLENPSDDEIAAKPALKLLDFYRGLSVDGALAAPLEVGRTKEASATMRSLGPVDEKLMDTWLKQWAF
ncbi:putative NRPS-like protein biosynthetic cluster [Paecilomyces lecythidis]|uniref:NRPS-like protein biosynthetic cluster n=1 Tax=Paecilomyces lecythidis TaxID=3004212 RepID=A0ABR3YC77_9EURO